jgi:hypothetical protein
LFVFFHNLGCINTRFSLKKPLALATLQPAGLVTLIDDRIGPSIEVKEGSWVQRGLHTLTLWPVGQNVIGGRHVNGFGIPSTKATDSSKGATS